MWKGGEGGWCPQMTFLHDAPDGNYDFLTTKTALESVRICPLLKYCGWYASPPPASAVP